MSAWHGGPYGPQSQAGLPSHDGDSCTLLQKPWGDMGCPCPLYSPSQLLGPRGSCRVWHSSPLASGVRGPRAGCGSVPVWGWGLWLQSRLWVAQCRGKPCPWRQLWAALCSAAAGVLYAAAIVMHNQQPAHVLKALLWLLITLGSAALDVAISFPSSSPRALGWDE